MKEYTDIINSQPLNEVKWIHRDELKPNNYNPNKVAPPEMELLIISILETGWTQPIVVNDDMTIVDGFHRYTVSGYSEMMKRFGGYVPVVILKNADQTSREMATIRHNRARGTHGVLPMSEIVGNMLRRNVSKEEIMQRLGMEEEEVNRLAYRDGVHKSEIISDKGFSKSWSPE